MAKNQPKKTKQRIIEWNPGVSPLLNNHDRLAIRKAERKARAEAEEKEDAPFIKRIVK